MRARWMLGVRGRARALLLLHVCALASAQPASLAPSDIVISSSNGSATAVAPGVYLGGSQVGGGTGDASACGDACRLNSECDWFVSCNQQNGCASGPNGSMVFQECVLLHGNCSLIPPVLGRASSVAVTSGFPVRTVPLELPGYVTHTAQGLDGGDFECPGMSSSPGQCTFASAVTAASVCPFLSACRAIVVYTNGTDSCGGGELAVLKDRTLLPGDGFITPSVYTLEVTEALSNTSAYLSAGEATIIPPDASAAANSSSAANSSADPSNSTQWLGCMVAEHALMAGEVVQLLEGVQSAEACCRACRQREPAGSCNVFNWCPVDGCEYQDPGSTVTLQQYQCELRHQQLVDPHIGWPPSVLVKGPSVNSTGGAPLSVVGPPVDGFTTQLAAGLWGQPGYECASSLKPDLQECVLSMPLSGLADHCLSDPLCAAFVYQPDGLFMSESDVGYFRHTDGTNLSRLVYTPSSVLYVRQGAVADPSAASSGSGGLSTAAIAGIAAGAAAAVIVAAVAGWVYVRRRRRRAAQEPDAGDKGALGYASGKAGGGLEEGHSGGSGFWVDDNCSPALSAAHCSGALPPGLGSLKLEAAAAALVLMDSGGGPATLSPAARSVLQPDTPSSMRGGGWPSVSRAPSGALRSGVPRGVSSSGSRGEAARIVSPFAAASRRMTELDRRPSAPVLQVPHAPTSPDSLGAGELSGLLVEVLQHRAAQEQASQFTPAGSNSGNTTDSHTGGSSSSSPVQLVTATLPDSLREWVIPPKQIEYSRRPDGSPFKLGEGAGGAVYKAVYNGEVCAAKEIPLDKSEDVQEAFVAEAMRLQLLRHHNVVGFYGVSITDDSRGILVMEYCPGHDLYSVLGLCAAGTRQRLFGWYRHGCRIACEVATALNYLHSKGVVHMDIKSHNVLLNARGVAKLADVGVSRLQTKTFLSAISPVGTFAWVAPEVLMGGIACTQAVDLFSFGVLMWEIITGERPIRGQLRMPLVPEECPQEVSDLMMECLTLDPTTRPTALQLMQRLAAMHEDLERRQSALLRSPRSSQSPK